MSSRIDDNSSSGRQSDDALNGSETASLSPYIVARRTRCLVCDDVLVESIPATDEDELDEFLEDSPSAQGLVCRGCRRFWEFDVLEFRPPEIVERRIVLGCRILAGAFLIGIPMAAWLVMPRIAEFAKFAPIKPEMAMVLISMLTVCGAMFAGLLLLVRTPIIAIATSEGIDWRKWASVLNHRSWASITRVHYDPARRELALVDNDENRLRRIEKIIVHGRNPTEMSHIAAELRRRWLSKIYSECRDLATKLDASTLDQARLLRLRQKGRPRTCPTCRRNLTAVPRRSSDCPICRFAGDADTLIYRHRDTGLKPVFWASLAAIAAVAQLAYFACREAGFSISISASAAVSVACLAPVVYLLGRRAAGRSPRLVIHRDAIFWTTPNGKSVRLPWNEIDTVLDGPMGERSRLRMRNGDMKLVPWGFLPQGFPASDFAALIELARREYSCQSEESNGRGGKHV